MHNGRTIIMIEEKISKNQPAEKWLIGQFEIRLKKSRLLDEVKREEIEPM